MNAGKTGEPIDLVILAGGAATRLGALATKPKSLLSVSGVPFLALQVAELARTCTPRRVILCVRKGTGMHFRDFARKVEYPVEILEENDPLGTGGAIVNALTIPGLSNPFAVANGDVLFRMDVARLRAAAQTNGAAIGVINVPDASRFGAVVVENGLVTQFVEKGMTGPGLVSAGLYAFMHHALTPFTPGPLSFETGIAPGLAAKGALAAIAMNGPFIDIGTPRSLAAADGFVGRFAS